MTKTTSELQLFSVDRANRTLPLVRRIVDDIVVAHPRWRDLVARYELLAAGARPEHGESEEMHRLRRDIEAAAMRINGYVAELELIGPAEGLRAGAGGLPPPASVFRRSAGISTATKARIAPGAWDCELTRSAT